MSLEQLLHSERAAIEHSINLLLLPLCKTSVPVSVKNTVQYYRTNTSERIYEIKGLILSLSPLVIMAETVLSFRLPHTATKPTPENDFRLLQRPTHITPFIQMGLLTGLSPKHQHSTETLIITPHHPKGSISE